MKKMLTCCAILALALSLFCVGASAADLDVQVSPTNADAVQVAQKEGSADPIFTVTKSSGAQAGQLYLVLIQKGSDASATPKPTVENLYYLNVEEAGGASFTTEAYPRDMAEGDYIVYLSDYSGNAQGKAQGVATIKVSAKPGGSGDTKYGDVNGDGAVDVKDRAYLTRYLAHWDGYSVEINVGDLNDDGAVDVKDRAILTRYLAHWDGYATLPYKS